jgi:hypothetical protein
VSQSTNPKHRIGPIEIGFLRRKRLTRSGDLKTHSLKLGDGKAPDLAMIGDFNGDDGIAINDAIASVRNGA